MDWTPTLGDRSGPVYEGIVEALAADVASGRLHRGERLPTHRALAQALGVDLTTVTRAYNEARRRGLTEARVGQGTFVAESAARAPRAAAAGIEFDLSMNLPPEPIEADLDGRLARGLEALRRDYGFTDFLNYQQAGGSEADRGIAADWLRKRVRTATADRLLIFPGTQTVLMSLLLALLKPGDTLLTDPLTYPGVKSAAAAAGVRLVGVENDRNGMIPMALEDACRRHKPRAVYLIPTIHNPTTLTIPPARRTELATTIRKRDLLLFEDDAYGSLDPETGADRHVDSRAQLSRGDAVEVHRARLAHLLPADARSRGGGAARQHAAHGGADAGAADGGAHAALAGRRQRRRDHRRHRRRGSGAAEARGPGARRSRLCRASQAGIMSGCACRPPGPAWSSPLMCRDRGLPSSPATAFTVDGTPEHAIRIALGAARTRTDLVGALDVLSVALKSPVAVSRIV